MVLVRQQTTAGFRPKSRYNMLVDRLSKCLLRQHGHQLLSRNTMT